MATRHLNLGDPQASTLIVQNTPLNLTPSCCLSPTIPLWWPCGIYSLNCKYHTGRSLGPVTATFYPHPISLSIHFDFPYLTPIQVFLKTWFPFQASSQLETFCGSAPSRRNSKVFMMTFEAWLPFQLLTPICVPTRQPPWVQSMYHKAPCSSAGVYSLSPAVSSSWNSSFFPTPSLLTCLAPFLPTFWDFK